MSMRYAQGHSFSNLGFAFGQLGELEKSQEHFMHALQAAKDCQDFRGQWQAYEGLSAVHFQKKDYEKSVYCLKTALKVLPQGGVQDDNVQERIVAKLSNALESQLADKQRDKAGKMDDKKNGSARGKERNIRVQMDTRMVTDGSLRDNGKSLQDNNGLETSTPKVGRVRPREKNHKFIARGLDIDEPSSDNERSEVDSTFDTISSYSGEQSSSLQEGASQADSVHEDQLESTAGSAMLPPPKKDPLNNTYEEPNDIINAIETGTLRLHELPPGPRDTVLAAMSEEDSRQLVEDQSKNEKKKSTVCVIQ